MLLVLFLNIGFVSGVNIGYIYNIHATSIAVMWLSDWFKCQQIQLVATVSTLGPEQSGRYFAETPSKVCLKCSCFHSNVTDLHSWAPNWQICCTGLGTDSLPKRRRAITETSDVLITISYMFYQALMSWVYQWAEIINEELFTKTNELIWRIIIKRYRSK